MHSQPSSSAFALRRPLQRPSTVWLSGTCLVLGALAATAWPRLVAAADAPAAQAHAGGHGAAAALVPGRSYVVMPGDTLDRVVAKAMTGSPLKNEVLREALVAANAQVLPAGKNPRLVPGTVLTLPDPEAVLRNLASSVSASAEPQLAPASGDSRRRWVRFP